MTTPELLARSHGVSCAGLKPCFWCGAPAEKPFRQSDTFADWAEVARPASRSICAGCVLATDESDRSKRPRFFSWVVSTDSARSYPKGDRTDLRTACLVPPLKPFAITIAVSGQKHLLYRTPVNYSRNVVTVQLELEHVTYRPAQLADAIALCGQVAAAAGKPALAEPPTTRLATALADYWTDFDPLLSEWLALWQQPHMRLAAFLTSKMEDCRHEYPSDIFTPAAPAVRRASVSTPARGADRPGLFG